MGSLDNTDQRNSEIIPSSSHTLRDTTLHHHSPPSERYHMSLNVHPSSSEKHGPAHNVPPSTPEMKLYSEGSKRTESKGRGLERARTRERVDDLEASIDAIDGLVTSLSDFAMRSQVC